MGAWKITIPVLLAALAAVFLFTRSCEAPKETSFYVKPGHTSQLVVDFGKRAITESGESKAIHSPFSARSSRRAVITVEHKEGGTTIKVTPKTAGFVFEPGIGLGYARNGAVLADVQWSYWRGVGIHCGAAYQWGPRSVLGYAAVSASPFRALGNTSFLFGITTNSNFLFGVRVSL